MSTRTRPAGGPTLREKVLDAAENVVLGHGVADLTLEAVAGEAGVSKGGLLYHFPSKNALIQAMIVRLIDDAEERIARYRAQDAASGQPGGFARAVVAAFVDSPCASERDARIGAAIMAAAAHEPNLLEPLRQAYRRWFEKLATDALPPGHGLLVMAAVDGLWFWHLFGLLDPPADEMAACRNELRRIAAVRGREVR